MSFAKLKGEETTNVLSEFSRLCQNRDLAAYRAVAAIQTVVLFWEAQDYDDVLAQLQRALADFKAADARISQFRNSYQGALDRHGHTISAASWKQIASHFGREIRTVQRWEKSEGLPVHRHSHGAGDSVFAYRYELNAWWAGRCHMGNQRRTTLTIPLAELGALPHAQMASLRTLLEAVLERLHEESRHPKTEPSGDQTFSRVQDQTCDL
jgi:hypothetical protein